MPDLAPFLSDYDHVVEITLTRVKGSSPRDAGTVMYAAKGALWGTVGGGQLEYMLIDHARAMLAKDVKSDTLNIPLGPEIGQCCGGHVTAALMQMDQTQKAAAITAAQETIDALPHVYVMGAGHVGRALASQLQHLPVRCILIDPRADELAQNKADVETRLSVMPELDIRMAPKGSAFVILTHDHALDFMLTSAALARGDAAYVGMIGSATKRAKFAAWCRAECDDQTIDKLICPIGASGSRDKRPCVIAALVAAEVIAEMTSETTAPAPLEGKCLPHGTHATGPKTKGTHAAVPVSRPSGGGPKNDRTRLHI